MVDKKNILGYVFTIILILFFFYLDNKKKNLKDNFEIQISEIYETGTSKSGATLKYKYKVNGIVFQGVASYGGAYTSVHKRFLNYKLLVAYQKNDPGNNELLLLKSDFEKYNLIYPDSLKWVQDFQDFP